MNHIALNFLPSSTLKIIMHIIKEHFSRKKVFHICCHIILHMSVATIMAYKRYLTTLAINQTFLYFSLLHSQKATDLGKGQYAYTELRIFESTSLRHVVLTQLDFSSLIFFVLWILNQSSENFNQQTVLMHSSEDKYKKHYEIVH